MASILILFMVALGLFVTVTVAAATQAPGMRPRHHRDPYDPFAPRGPRAPENRRVQGGMDPALAELRMRYARGEVGREEFLQRKIDLE